MSSLSSQVAKQAAGQVQVEPLLCKSCGLCAEYCPQDTIRAADEIPPEQRTGPMMNPAGHIVYQVFDPAGKCTGCGICATACPEGAVVVYRRKRARSDSETAPGPEPSRRAHFSEPVAPTGPTPDATPRKEAARAS